MKVYYFSEFPYHEYPDEEGEKYPSLRLTFPNTYFKPNTANDLFKRYFDECVYVDEMGFDGIMVNEHHNTPSCMNASCNLTAAVLARITQQAKILLLGNILPIHENPVRLAEEIAMIDVISGGRVISGMVRGTGVESLATNGNPIYNRERFEECHDLVIKTWSTPGPFRWEGFDPAGQALLARSFEGRMTRFAGYLPGVAERFELELVSASDEADLALLCCIVSDEADYLPLAEVPPEPGEAVLVLGFPLGVRALMARTNPEFVEGLRDAGITDFWEVAARLSRAGHVTPLATRGIVGQVTTQNVVYDAETTSGGSGGPVLSLDGQVVAINSAILPEFGGSNLGVPAARARELLSVVRPLP